MEEKKMNTIFTNTSPNRIFQLRVAGRIPPALAEDEFCQSEMVLRLADAINVYYDTIQQTPPKGMQAFLCEMGWVDLEEEAFPWMSKDSAKEFIKDIQSIIMNTEGMLPEHVMSIPWPMCSKKRTTNILASYMKDYISTLPRNDKNFDKAVKLGADFVNVAVEINTTILDVQETVMYEYLKAMIDAKNSTKNWLSDKVPFGITQNVEQRATVRDIANAAIGFIEKLDCTWKKVPRRCLSLITPETFSNFYDNVKTAVDILNELVNITNNKIIPKKLSKMLSGWAMYTFNLGKKNNIVVSNSAGEEIKWHAIATILIRAACYGPKYDGIPRLICNAVDIAMWALYKNSLSFSGEYAIYDDDVSDNPKIDYLENIGITDNDFSKLSMHVFDQCFARDLFEIQIARTFGAEERALNCAVRDGMKSPFELKQCDAHEDNLWNDNLFAATLDGSIERAPITIMCKDLIYHETEDNKDQVSYMSEKQYRKAIRNEIKAREEGEKGEEPNVAEED